MKLLVIGGTRFVGRHIVEAALAAGHDVTLFHRGKSGDDLFPEARRILGDRDGGMDAVGDESWDAVIDTCGYHPRVVRQSVENLSGRAGYYLFVSTLSVYAEENPQDKSVGEEGAVIRLDPMPESEEITNEAYGGFKVLCEEAIQQGFKGKVGIVRPGLVIGPHDVSDRFTYWVDRFQGPSAFIVPSPATGRIQFIDARDLAAFALKLVSDRVEGTFNVVSPGDAITYDEMFHTIRMNTDGDSKPELVDEAWLLKNEVKPWVDMPLWIPASEPAGMHEFGIKRALDAGFLYRSLGASVRDIATWNAARQPVTMKTGLTRAREEELLGLWAAEAGV